MITSCIGCVSSSEKGESVVDNGDENLIQAGIVFDIAEVERMLSVGADVNMKSEKYMLDYYQLLGVLYER